MEKHNTTDYSTITPEKSMVITNSTTYFDLYKGFIFMFLSCFFKSLFSILCKFILSRNFFITSFHLLTFKAYIMLCLTILMSIYYYFFGLGGLFNFTRKSMNMIIIRSTLSVISISLTIFALKYVSISDVYSVFYIYPGVVMLLSYFLLKEKVGWFDYVCLVSCFTGVILIIRPEVLFPNEMLNGSARPPVYIFILVIIGAVMKAFEDVIIRNIGLEMNYLAVPAIYSVIAMILYPIPMGLTIDNSKYIPSMDKLDFLIIILIALFSFVYQALMTLAIQYENAGRVAMINYFQVFFMFLSDIFIFQKNLIFFDVLGTFLIFGFNLANGIKKVMKRSDDLNKVKKNII